MTPILYTRNEQNMGTNMRCKACNDILNDYELSRKDRETGEFLDLCGNCLTASNYAMLNYDIDTGNESGEVSNILNGG